MSSMVGQRVNVEGFGTGVATAWADDPTYLVDLDSGGRMMVPAARVTLRPLREAAVAEARDALVEPALDENDARFVVDRVLRVVRRHVEVLATEGDFTDVLALFDEVAS